MKSFVSIGAIALAATACLSGPALADTCEVGWDVPCCMMPGQTSGVANTTLTICNCTNQTAEYAWGFAPTLPSGVFPSPSVGAVTLEPGECVDIPLQFNCPAGIGPFQFTAQVFNITTGQVTECTGSVKAVFLWKVQALDDVIEGPIPMINEGIPMDVELLVHNIGSSGKDGVRIDLSSMGPIEPIEPTIMTAPIPAGESRIITTQVLALPPAGAPVTEGGAAPMHFADLLIAWDEDGDGVGEVNSSVKFKFAGINCPGDINGDGIVNGADLAALLANWGLCN